MNTDRISKNEKRLDSVSNSIIKMEEALNELKSNLKALELLNNYYGSSVWFKDKEDYENNIIPSIKAGVLSEDAVWNLNENLKDLFNEMEFIKEQIYKKKK